MDAKNFKSRVTKKLGEGEAALFWLLKAFQWSVNKGLLIKKHNKGWSQDWFASEIKRIYNINPYVYPQIVAKLGGGNTSVGEELVAKHGVYETYRAARILTDKSLLVLRREPKKTNKQTFRERVTTLFEKNEGKAKIKRGPTSFVRVDKDEYRRLKEDQLVLQRIQQELEEAQAALKKYKRVVAGLRELSTEGL